MLQQPEVSPRNHSTMVDTCKLQVHVGLHLYFQELGLNFFVYSMWRAWTKIFRGKAKFFANVLKYIVPDLNTLVRDFKYLNHCTILCCTKNPVIHTHTHTLRVQTLFSHSDKSSKQTKTETSQQGSHRQKSPWPEVIRCYGKQ